MDRGSTREDGAGRENTGRGSLTPGVTQGGHQRLPPRLHVDGTLPLAGIKQRLEREGVACTLSEDAGSYLCNAVFYWLARRGLPEGTPVGFVHLPHGAEAQPDNLKALHAAAEETARRLAAQRVEATA